MALQATTFYEETGSRADFHRPEFETLIQQKGRRVLKESSLVCPCKSKSTNQQSNCKNCGGTGWVFINPVETRMILKGMKITPNYKAWSEEIVGDLDVTASDIEELTFMDRLTLLDGKAIYNEVLFFKNNTANTITFAFTAYAVKKVLYMGYFVGVDDEFQQLVLGTDYTVDNNIVKLINPAIVAVQDFISITIRYIHAPVYLMVDMKRESMETFELTDKEELIHLPIAGTARRQHYILGSPTLNGDALLNNSIVSTC